MSIEAPLRDQRDRDLIRNDIARLGKLVKDANIKRE